MQDFGYCNHHHKVMKMTSKGPGVVNVGWMTLIKCVKLDIQIAQLYINALRSIELDQSGLSEAALETLTHPPEHSIKFGVSDEEKDILFSLDLFIGLVRASEKEYTSSRAAVQCRYPSSPLLSYAQVKSQIASLTGIHPITHDMCPNTYHKSCPRCDTSRYDLLTNHPHQQFYTLPLGPYIQTLYRDSKTAQLLGHFGERLQLLLEQVRRGEPIKEYDDICCGKDILEALSSEKISSNDVFLMVSMDGAQLYRMKASDCWMYIWILVGFSPNRRYKKKYVVPGGVIPGPDAPKITQSFLFPSLAHIAAVNKSGGLRIWNAYSNIIRSSKLFILLATADSLGLVHFSGGVGHTGKNGCRVWCGQPGRHKDGEAMYYPVMFKPDAYIMPGCNFNDLAPDNVYAMDPQRYQDDLQVVMASRTAANYSENRCETGIKIPSIFLGDIMHLILNLADILIPLWRGSVSCDRGDDISTWVWAVLKDKDTWEKHGADVANCTPYLPGLFDRPPHNPAEKINSGYKAWEFLLYLFGLGPGLLYNILPLEYWKSYCKLCAGIRYMYQYKITCDQLKTMHILLIQFGVEYERLYVQRKISQIHFVRQSIHFLRHAAPEVERVGPGIAYSQWTMERSIGNLTEEIGQDSNPYKNLSERCLRRSQTNSLKAAVPALDSDCDLEGKTPRGGLDLGNNFVLLCKKDQSPCELEVHEMTALQAYAHDSVPAHLIPNDWKVSKVQRWARLRLPTGQIARSMWRESLKDQKKIRRARDVKLNCNGKLEFAEVHFFFRLAITKNDTRTLAMVTLYTEPNPLLLRLSSSALWSCEHGDVDATRVVNVTEIEAVIAMFLGEDWKERVFVVEKPGLDVARMSGFVEDEDPEDNEGEDE
ncbi:hypothetical protein C8J55DRAFT_536243 [Lentinula edodes]|uniref:Uncharacterized protein n=1 Tax=Lentinula lateritia TaxID=40482 RepID=A0A9W9ADR7_9AGAR|nr:hypothetical protein C8J55DRAFT_536243 [Lentinula edodes]